MFRCDLLTAPAVIQVKKSILPATRLARRSRTEWSRPGPAETVSQSRLRSHRSPPSQACHLLGTISPTCLPVPCRPGPRPHPHKRRASSPLRDTSWGRGPISHRGIPARPPDKTSSWWGPLPHWHPRTWWCSSPRCRRRSSPLRRPPPWSSCWSL